MTEQNKLQVIFEQIKAGKALSPTDLQILVSAVQSQRVTIATGAQAGAIGGNADNAVIVTGDRNILIPKELAQAIQEKIQGAGSVEQQFSNWALPNEDTNAKVTMGPNARPANIVFFDSYLDSAMPGAR